MTDVFISYSRRDKVFTQKLVDALQAANREVWAHWNCIPAASDGMQCKMPSSMWNQNCASWLEHIEEGNRVINALLAKLLDENDNPQHNYSREELIALLDKHLEERNKTF